jgi:DNA-binding transcriptional LysR family regulator
MSRPEINRYREMEVYVTAVEMGGFTPASQVFSMTPSAVSKLVARLEARLEVRLVNRSTRGIQLTREGCLFYEDVKRLLADLHMVESKLNQRSSAAGTVRLNTSASYARHILAPLLPQFVEKYPNILLQLIQTDQVVDLLTERADIAVRAGPLPSSSLIARKLGESRKIVVAAPTYLRRHGPPVRVADLLTHRLINSSTSLSHRAWRFKVEGEEVSIKVNPSITAADGEGVRDLVKQGLGIARMPKFTIAQDIEDGNLFPLLESYSSGETETFHALYLSHEEAMPTRVRLALKFIADNGVLTD